MGIFTRDRPEAPPRPRPMVGAGRQIVVDDTQQLARFRVRTSQDYWQERAAVFNDSLPILGYSHDYVRDAMARVWPVAAIGSEDPTKTPVPLTDETAPDGLDPALCAQILQRLAPFPEYMGQTAQKFEIFGECYGALIEDDIDGDGEERCRIFSPREIFVQGDEWRWKRDPADGIGVAIKPGTPFWRMWQPHPEFYSLPYSHMIRLLLPCKELLLLSQLVAALATSRIATTGKFLAIADEFSLEQPTADGQADTDAAGDGAALDDSFIEDLYAAMTAAINNPDSAAALAPLILRGPHNLIKDGVQVIDIERKFEETLIKLRQEAREEIATGVNLPREIPLGVGSTNHWNDQTIREDTWLNHLEPRGMTIMAATASSFYRPALLANGVDPAIVRRCTLIADPTWFLGAPDRSDKADEALGHFAISLDAYREARNWGPDDAPTPEEIQMRIGWAQQQLVRTTIREDAGAAEGEVQVVDPGDSSAPQAESQKVDVSPVDDKSAPDLPTTASAQPSKLDRLGPKLVAIERDLRTKLHATTEQIVSLALIRAGMKAKSSLESLARKSSSTVRAQHNQQLEQLGAIPREDIVWAMGRTKLVECGLNDEQLLAGALAGLEPKFHQLVTRAQLASARAAADASGRDVDEAQIDQATKDARAAGWALLAGGVMTLARGLLYNPHPSAPEVGEFDEASVVPMGLIRAALDRAGGAAVGAAGRNGVPATVPSRSTGPGGEPGGGGATAGPTMLDEFKQQLGITEDSYTWAYGDADRREFPPHADLDGVTFTAWDDDVLANGEGWPDVAYYAPGDHQGCLCDFAIAFSQAEVSE